MSNLNNVQALAALMGMAAAVDVKAMADAVHDKAAERGLTLAEHYRSEAIEAAKSSQVMSEEVLVWCIQNTPGVGVLSEREIADIITEAVDVFHDRRAREAAEGCQ
jgi:hypothetical protein